MAVIRLWPSGHEIPCASGMTVLAALEAEGWALPNNCRAGTCGECKVRVRAGEFDQGFVLDMALSPEERAEGFGAMCMAKPLGDLLEIEWGTADAKPVLFPPREQMRFTLIDRIERSPSIVEVRLLPCGEPMRFWPGQHVQLGDPPDRPLRNYSMANAPRPDGEVTLLVTREPFGRTSVWLADEVPVGSELLVNGPYGSFIGDPAIAVPVVCLAGGSGLAPILSLTLAALRRGFAHPVDLVFSARTPADVMLLGLARGLEHRYPNFHLTLTLTGTHETEPAFAHHHGRIPQMLEEVHPSLADHAVFIAGSDGFVSDCTEAARRLGATAIYAEPFTEQGDLSALSIWG